jgi:ribosomal protein L7/L12
MEMVAAVGAAVVLFLILRALSRGGQADPLDNVPPTDESIRELLLRGRNIQAIKAYRRLYRVDLKTAKEAIERIAEELPAAR